MFNDVQFDEKLRENNNNNMYICKKKEEEINKRN